MDFAFSLQPSSSKIKFPHVLLRSVCRCLLMDSNLIQPRQRSFCSPQVVGKSRFHMLLLAWGLLSLLRPPLFVTSVSTSTRISAWPHIFPRQFQVAFCDEINPQCPPICLQGGFAIAWHSACFVACWLWLAGLPARRLQSVVHAAALIVFSARKFDRVTPLLLKLYWLRIPVSGTDYFLAVVPRLPVSQRHSTCVPRRQHQPRNWRHHEAESAFHQQWSLFQWLDAARSGIALSRLLLPVHGTVYHRLSRYRRHCRL